MTRLLYILLPFLAALAVIVNPVHADHKNNGHLYPPASQYEMNSRTTNALPIPIRYLPGTPVTWLGPYAGAINAWNNAMQSITGFTVFENSSLTGYMSFRATDPSGCGMGSHGCVLDWNPATPSGTIALWANSGVFTTPEHRQSDIMHEFGHVLYNASEHYPTYNCTSIMGHSGPFGGSAGSCGNGTPAETLTAVQDHDKDDYRAAYRVLDTADATYLQIGFGALIHYFEGGYQGGNGRTIHQEFEYVIDRATESIDNPYSFYSSTGRRVDNEDDTVPESHTVSGFPPTNGEWCFKLHGHSKAVAAGSPGEWGPFSKRYCIARSGSGTGVFVTSDRNGQAHFRIANFTGATITNAQLRSGNPGNQICYFGDVADATIEGCSVAISGPGALSIWYNGSWVPVDWIGYDQ